MTSSQIVIANNRIDPSIFSQFHINFITSRFFNWLLVKSLRFMKRSFKILRIYASISYVMDKIFFSAIVFLLATLLLFVIDSKIFFISLLIAYLIFLITFLNYFCIWYLLNYIYLKRQPKFEEYKTKGDYLGIVVTTSNLQFWKYCAIYTSGLILLIGCFKNKKIPYKLLTNFNGPFDTKKFKELVYDENCKELYISGHGRKHRLQISKKQNLYYFLYPNAHKKDKVVQLHCNHGGGKSLADFLNNIKYFLNKTKY